MTTIMKMLFSVLSTLLKITWRIIKVLCKPMWDSIKSLCKASWELYKEKKAQKVVCVASSDVNANNTEDDASSSGENSSEN